MFFRAFSVIESSPLSRALTFKLEYEASLAIIYCDREYLARILRERTLPESILQEIEFWGAVPRGVLNVARMYFYSQERSLASVAEEVLRNPDNEVLLQSIIQPITEEWRNIFSESEQL